MSDKEERVKDKSSLLQEERRDALRRKVIDKGQEERSASKQRAAIKRQISDKEVNKEVNKDVKINEKTSLLHTSKQCG